MPKLIRNHLWPLLATVLLVVTAIVIGCGSTGFVVLHKSTSSVAFDRAEAVAFDRAAAGAARAPVPASSLPAPSEELWVIAKPAKAQATNESEPAPRSGALVVQEGEKVLPFPLKHTDVNARIDGYIASVDVTQQYHNPFESKIEAVYVFPLPESAAVNEFVMTIGERTIRGIIREREEAAKIYEEAKRQGYVASLLQQERPNIFTQKVANIEPGKQVDVSIRYFHTLAFSDGWYEFVFPMVVGPRFNPPHITDGVGAVPVGTHGTSGQKTEVQYLKPDERTGHDIALQVDVNAGVPIQEIKSVNHQVAYDGHPTRRTYPKDFYENDGHQWVRVNLKDSDALPNKDFVLRFRVAGEMIASNVIAQRNADGKGGYFTLMIYPPLTTENLARRPVDLCFTLDVSGSMTGAPIGQSKEAILAALDLMQEGDTFQIVRFAGSSDQLAPDPLPVTRDNIRQAKQFIEKTSAGGGTMMLEGIKRSLNQPTSEERVRYVCMMTDGYIGNETEIIKATRELRNQTRVFGFGVGSSPNRYLIDGMSRAGAGAVAYLSLHDDGEDVMKPFFERISKPAMTGIEIDTSNLPGAQLNPFKIPDVYVGRAVLVTGKFDGPGGTITVRGRVGEQRVERTFVIKPEESGTSIASVWARQQIASLCDQAMFDGNIDLPAEVKKIALNYSLLSDFTSFVAVDSSRQTQGTSGTTIVQPVPMPDGVKYETTVAPGATP